MAINPVHIRLETNPCSEKQVEKCNHHDTMITTHEGLTVMAE